MRIKYTETSHTTGKGEISSSKCMGAVVKEVLEELVDKNLVEAERTESNESYWCKNYCITGKRFKITAQVKIEEVEE